MANNEGATWLADEIADFLASCPSAEELLAYRPSPRATRRLAALRTRLKAGELNRDEQWELDQFEHVEMLMQAIKAKLRPAKQVRV